MSRYDVEKFHPPPDPELICCICQCVLDNAKESPCRHVFCKVCIEQWLNDHNSCPTCRTWLSKRDLQNVLPLVQNMINKLVMYCDYRCNGCEQKLVLEIYDAHVQKCDFKLLQCPNVGCNVSLLRKDLSQHANHICEFRQVICNKGCHLKIPINDLNFHNCMIALKQKSEKQQKLIEEFLKKIQELISLKDLLKKKVENLQRNIDRSTPLRGESLSSLFSSSYEEDEDITPINVVPRGGDNTDARLSVISNYFEFYANAVDRITSEVSQIQTEANIVFNSEFGSASNNTTFSLLQDDSHTPPSNENRRSQRRSNDNATPRSSFGGNQMRESLDTMNRDRYSLPVTTYLAMSLDQAASVRAESISPSIAAETVSGSTGTDDGYNLTDRELDVSYVADSEDGNNSAVEYNYDNVSDNGIFESDEDDEEDEDDDYDDVPSDVSSSIQSSLLANVHSESVADEAEPTNDLTNLYEESAELWTEHNNANQSTENANLHPSETVQESDNVSINAVDGDSYLQRSEENYLSSNYISSPSVTSVQYSPVLSSSPFQDSDSEIYEHSVAMYSDLSDDEDDDDDDNQDIELVLDTEVTFSSPTAEHASHRTTNNNTHTEDSHVVSDEEDANGSDEENDDDDDEGGDGDRSNNLYGLAVSDCPSSPVDDDDDDDVVDDDNDEQNNEEQHFVCVLESSDSACPVENTTTSNTQDTELNEVSITHICTSNNKSSANNNNNNTSVEHLERSSSQTAMYHQRQRYINTNSESVTGQHNLTRYLQTGKESLRFSQRVLFDSTEPHCPVSSVSIKIEPNQDITRTGSSSEITDVQKTVLSTRASYNSRITQGCLQVNSAGTGETKPLSERVMHTDISSRYTLSSQRTFNNLHVNRCPKRPNTSSTETRPLVKRRKTRDYYNSTLQPVPTTAVCNRVDLSVINVRESPGQTLPKRHRCSRYSATVSTPAVSTPAIMTPTITSNNLPAAGCTYSPRLMLNSGRQPVPSGGRIRRTQRKSTREWQVNIQPDANDIRVVEERTMSSVSTTETAIYGNQTFRDRRHSHQPEYTVEQADFDDASYEASDSYSDTDGQETDSSYEVLVPKSISQLLEEYDSEETDESWTVDMA